MTDMWGDLVWAALRNLGDRLALVAIDEGMAAPISPIKIVEARKELARGDEAAARGQADEAIDHYRDAWKQALQI